MGARGPIGKRSDQRHGHRSAAEQALTVKAEGSAQVRMPPADRTWHKIARGMYESLAKSGQAQFFEPSDWQAARLAAEATTQLLHAEKFSAMLLSAVNDMWARLLMTEGDRRRLKIELEKPKQDAEAAAAVADLDQFRSRLSG